MPGRDIPKSEIKNRLVDALGSAVEWHGNTNVEGREPFYIHLRPPLPRRIRSYLFYVGPSGRERRDGEEYKINNRLPEDIGNDDSQVTPDRSEGYFVLIGGYNEEFDVFVFWDDSLYESYSSNNPSLQVSEATLERAEVEGIWAQPRPTGGDKEGETVVAARPDHIREALQMRYRLIRNRRLLSEFLPESWRDSSVRAQTVERTVDVFLEETDKEASLRTRRQSAIEQVAEEQNNEIDTVEQKLKGDLWTDRSPSSEGYIPTYFDPLLADIEEIVTEKESRESGALLNHIDSIKSEAAIYVVSLPPEDWIGTLRYSAIPLTEDDRTDWEDIKEDDIILFYSHSKSEITETGDYETGIIGGAIVKELAEPRDEQWYSETNSDEDHSHIIRFKREFYTGDVEDIEIATDFDEGSSDAEKEIAAITRNALPEGKTSEILGGAPSSEERIKGISRGERPTDLEPGRELITAVTTSLREFPSVNIYSKFSGTLSDEIVEGLHLPNQREQIKDQLQAALRTGKHIIMTGPPGTGKTEIAINTAEELAAKYPWQYSDSQVTTATADWSTFDTVGGYMPDEESAGGDKLTFSSGLLLNRFKDERTGRQRNEPVIIDELNRANIDEAFGQLFTVLSGQPVTLQYTKNGREIEITTSESLSGLPEAHQYVVPRSWRILATMNTYDKTSLYEMSYAFMRRFSFIPVNDPFREGSYETESELRDLMSEYADEWDLSPSSEQALAVAEVWKNASTAVDGRAIGPAIAKDMLENLMELVSAGSGSASDLEQPLTNVVINYIFPQLEGVPKRKQIVESITETGVSTQEIESAAEDMLELNFSGDE